MQMLSLPKSIQLVCHAHSMKGQSKFYFELSFFHLRLRRGTCTRQKKTMRWIIYSFMGSMTGQDASLSCLPDFRTRHLSCLPKVDATDSAAHGNKRTSLRDGPHSDPSSSQGPVNSINEYWAGRAFPRNRPAAISSSEEDSYQRNALKRHKTHKWMR